MSFSILLILSERLMICMSTAQPTTEAPTPPTKVKTACGKAISTFDSQIPLHTRTVKRMPPIKPTQAMITNNCSIFVRFISY